MGVKTGFHGATSKLLLWRGLRCFQVKIALEPNSAGPPALMVAFGICGSITTLRQLAQQFISVDRGHKHSSGKTAICIWMSGLRSELANNGDTLSDSSITPDPAHEPLNPDAVAFSPAGVPPEAAEDGGC